MRIDLRMTEPARSTGAEQFDRCIGELATALRRVVFPTGQIATRRGIRF